MKKPLGSLILVSISLFAVQNPNELLDSVDSYPTTAFEWDILTPYLTGFVFFLAGFLVAKFYKKDKPSKP